MTLPERTPRAESRHPWLAALGQAIGWGAYREDRFSLLARLKQILSWRHLRDRVWPHYGSATKVVRGEEPSAPATPALETPTLLFGGGNSGPSADHFPSTGPADTPTVKFPIAHSPDRSGPGKPWVWGYTQDELPGFEILGWIGGGGMGDVFRARQLHLDREVALKVLRPSFAAEPSRLARFRREAAVAAQLRGAHLLLVHDVLEVRGAPVLVMPLVEGSDLGRILLDRRHVRGGEPAEGRHPWAALDDAAFLERILPVLDQVVEAVAALHAAGVLHRDIKPSNVLVDDRGNVLLSDFGLARLGEEGSLTSSGNPLGSPGYMSPEQWAGTEDVDSRADLFGLGATLYQALTLQLPYGKVRLMPAGPPPVTVGVRQPLLSADFDAVLLKALELDRARRYASASELQDDWRCLRTGQLPSAPRIRQARRAVRWMQQRRRKLIACALVTVSVIALALLPRWLLAPRQAAPQKLEGGEDTSRDPVVPRIVSLTTEPPGAEVVLVPLDEKNGFPLPERAIFTRSPAGQLRLWPGSYLVVAEIPGRGFHEVYRHVPATVEFSEMLAHSRWTLRADGVIELPRIHIPLDDVARGMARFGQETDDRPLRVLPFYLDPTEVTVKQYRDVMVQLPIGLHDQTVDDAEPVRFVTWDEAVAYAELVGKRLPSDREFGYAATAGGTRRYPWGDEVPWNSDRPWPFGRVGVAVFDRTDTDPPVFGLNSNVAEWTDTWSPRPPLTTTPTLSTLGHGLNSRLVRGGPLSVIEGHPDPAEIARKSLPPEPILRIFRYPGLGFRCARSVQPRLLAPSDRAGPE